MHKHHCELGSIAITVNAKFTPNLGKIVRVIDSYGMMPWHGLEGLVQVWRVEVLCPESVLHYLYPKRHHLELTFSGPVPDCYLRPIVPLTGQLTFDFYEEILITIEESTL